jgi:hypothetical protein
MMSTVDSIIESATVFYKTLCEDQNGRYRSWEYCYKSFHDARNIIDVDIDYLSLQLAFYLASWGMYRGSSFLLQKDYKVHINIVKEILKPKYNCLFGIRCSEYKDDTVFNLLLELYRFIEKYYGEIRDSVKEVDVKSNLSSVLVTKVLMGTLGCVPAYDRYFIEGVKNTKVAAGRFGKNSILSLVDFYEKNESELEKARQNLDVCGLSYPQMKFLDMGFWQIGFDLNQEKGLKKAH